MYTKLNATEKSWLMYRNSRKFYVIIAIKNVMLIISPGDSKRMSHKQRLFFYFFYQIYSSINKRKLH